jgi:RND superfamily putative drug exporter
MFHCLGRIVRRAWWLLLLGWGLLLWGTWYVAPPWSEVAQDLEFAFLPESAPSRRAEKIYSEAFPDDRSGSNIVLVLHRTNHEQGLLKQDLKFIEDVVEPRLRALAESAGGLASEPAPSDEPLFAEETRPASAPRSIISRIRTPNTPGTGALLISPDQFEMLVVVELTTEFLVRANWPIIEKVQDLVGQLQARAPAGLDLALTGSAVIGRDHTLAQMRSARTTEVLTLVLVIGLLVAIYRAPLLALIPLVTVFIAVRLSMNLLAILGAAGYITLFQDIQTYITILAYGAGVDYCLFLMARYKEELASEECGARAGEPPPAAPPQGSPPRDAIACAIEGVGAALAASAATVICGIGMMIFAEFGKFREAGYAIPLSILIVLFATLTFTPAVLRLAGKWAFWPQGSGGARRPETESASAPPWRRLLRGGSLQRLWDDMGELLLRHPGRIWIITVALMAPFAILAGLFYNRLSYDLIRDLPPDSTSVTGTTLLQEHFPAGLMGPVSVLIINQNVDFSSAEGRSLVEELTGRLTAEKERLGLADIRSLSAPLGISPAAAQAVKDFELPEEVSRAAVTQGALQRYVTSLGGRDYLGTRLELVLAHSPFSHRSIDELGELERAVTAAQPLRLRQGAELYFAGMTPSVRDMADVMRRDRARIEILVLVSVFAILIVLLRRFVVTVYLLLSVLFNYYTTLGVSFALFWLLDPHGFSGIDWKVAIFLFTILIAVGEDYNIFLLTRVDEEERSHGPLRGITRALTLTGPIISSCGIIMAGTFASLLGGSLAALRQLGFALAFGVLLDTFVIRPILVPAFLIMLQSGRFRLPGWARTAPRA